jgi:hypothetical protein
VDFLCIYSCFQDLYFNLGGNHHGTHANQL